MDEWMNGWMDGWKDGRMEGWKDGRMEGWKDGRMEGTKKSEHFPSAAKALKIVLYAVNELQIVAYLNSEIKYHKCERQTIGKNSLFK
jgi:hypothetical protein